MNKEQKRKIIITSITVTIFSSLIKFLGLIKQTLIANKCGANLGTDAFYISTGIVGQFSTIIFSAIAVGLIPMYINDKEKKGKESANNLINMSIKVFIPISCLISILFNIFSPLLAKLIAPSFSNDNLLVLTKYLRIMSVSFVPWCYYLLLNVILESEKKFIYGKCLGLFQNLFLILGLIFLYKYFETECLVYAFLISGIVECILVTIVTRKEYKISLKTRIDKKKIKRILNLSFPLIIGSAVYEINDIVDKQISTGLGNGYASILTYGSTINDIITGIVVSSISAVLFSNFATWISRNEKEKVVECLYESFNMLCMFIFPLAFVCITFNKDIAYLFYGHGALSDFDIKLVGYVIVGYAIGFIFQMFRAIFIKVLYSFQCTKLTMINGLISILINIILSITLSKYLGLFGVAFATSISMFFATIILYKMTRSKLIELNYRVIVKEAYIYFIFGILSAIPIFILNNILNTNVYLKLFGLCSAYFIIYFILLIVQRNKYMIVFINKVKQKVGK